MYFLASFRKVNASYEPEKSVTSKNVQYRKSMNEIEKNANSRFERFFLGIAQTEICFHLNRRFFNHCKTFATVSHSSVFDLFFV